MNILYFEDNPSDVAIAREVLTKEWPDCSMTHADNLDRFRAALVRDRFDFVLSDFKASVSDGRAALYITRELSPATPVVFLSEAITGEIAFELIREGACDYVCKDRMDRLPMVIHRVLQERDERRRREQAEAELRASEERLRSIFLTMTEGVLLLDNAGRIISANASAGRILGRSVEKLLGRSFATDWKAIHEDLSPFKTDEFQQELTRNTAQAQRGMVMGIYQPRGSALVWVTVNAQPFRRSSKERLGVGVVTLHDITEKRSLEEQLFRAQRLESFGLLAAGIVHDLNNVLAPVLMGVPLLRQRATDARDQKLLNTLEKSAIRGADLVRQIFMFTKGVAGGHGVVHLKPLLRELGGFLEATLPKSIRIECDIPDSLWPVKGNPTQLHQVLLNLCVNARDAMAQGGTLRLAVKNYRLDLRAALTLQAVPPGPYTSIEISDTGDGIPSEVLERIWDPFFSTKNPDKGTGLGLSTVRGIVQQHHGHVDVQTELGKGTTFRVLLPAETDVSRAVDGVSASPFSGGRGRGELILVVDDEAPIRELATTLLNDQGFRVLVANDGIQAYSQLVQRGDEIKLVVTDLAMPELDGAALANLARREFPNIRILVISGLASTTNVHSDYKHNSDGFLLKPFKAAAFLSAIDQLLHPQHTA